MIQTNWISNVFVLLLAISVEHASSFIGGGTLKRQFIPNTSKEHDKAVLFMSKNKYQKETTEEEESNGVDISSLVEEAASANGKAVNGEKEEINEEAERDSKYMKMAIELAESW